MPSVGAPSAMGGSVFGVGGGGSAAPSSPTLCEVTPAEGDWAGTFFQDPLLMSLERSEQGLSGTLFIGGATEVETNVSPISGAIRPTEERGGLLHFVTRLGNLSYDFYQLDLQLTLSPDRTSMAGSYWVSGQGPLPAVFVRVPTSPLPPAIACSAVVSGACFDAPVVGDRASQETTFVLGDGDLLLVWTNQRAFQQRLAFARYDVDARVWTEPAFVHPETTAVDMRFAAANDRGDIVVSWRPVSRRSELWVGRYAPEASAWSVPELVSSTAGEGRGVFVNRAGDVSVAWQSGQTTWTRRRDAASGVWLEPRAAGAASADIDITFDGAGNGVALWAVSATHVSATQYELWANFGNPDGSWGDPRRIYVTESQILHPDVEIDEQGQVLAAWEHYGCAIMASTSALDTHEWSEPLAVRVEGGVEYPDARFTEDGTPWVTFARFGANGRLGSELLPANAWSIPEPFVREPPLYVNRFSIAAGRFDITAADGLATVPSLAFGTCEGY